MSEESSSPEEQSSSEELRPSEVASSGPPRSFYIIGIVALIWNLIGVMAYVMQVTMSDAALAALPEEQQAFIQNSPVWVTAAYAIAVNAGALGCVLLLVRQSWAYLVLVVSFAGIVIQNLYGYFMGGAVDVYGAAGVGLSVTVLAIGAFLIWYAKGATEKGWLK
jgi:hypothetical protein